MDLFATAGSSPPSNFQTAFDEVICCILTDGPDVPHLLECHTTGLTPDEYQMFRTALAYIYGPADGEEYPDFRSAEELSDALLDVLDELDPQDEPEELPS